MKKEDRTFRMYLEDILLSMERIKEYVADYDIEGFKSDNKTIDAVIRVILR